MEIRLTEGLYLTIDKWSIRFFWRALSFITIVYYPEWETPHYRPHWNGGREERECFDGTICFHRVSFNVTLFNLNKRTSNIIKFFSGTEKDPEKNCSVMHH